MDVRAAKKLEEINKLIFVKKYAEAERLLEQMLKDKIFEHELMIHLRFIELKAMLGKVRELHAGYVRRLQASQSKEDKQNWSLCVTMVEQHAEVASAEETIASYQRIILEYGPHAAAYYGIGLVAESQKNFERAIANYEKALNEDPNWSIAYFGISQCYYQLGDDKNGDHHFFIFEKSAPYNVYGNFETHRSLWQGFLEESRFVEAEMAIRSLSDWWLDNKGHCPTEIQIFEQLALAKISEVSGDLADYESRHLRAKTFGDALLHSQEAPENVLFFVAKVFEEFGELEYAVTFYRAVLKKDTLNPQIAQKIGGQFLTLGEYQLACDLFEEAYTAHPDSHDIRFCLLVARLKHEKVEVEEYLAGRERLRQLVDTDGDKVELLALLHSMSAKFDRDSEVHLRLAEIYLRLSQIDKAGKHLEKAYNLESKTTATVLRYAAYLMQYKDPEKAMQVLDSSGVITRASSEQLVEVDWLKAGYYLSRKDYKVAMMHLDKVMGHDPWNVSYIVQEVILMTEMSHVGDDLKVYDSLLEQLSTNDDSGFDWREFEEKTLKLEQVHAYDIAYARRKLHYLYSNGNVNVLKSLLDVACRFNPDRTMREFIKLLNTNFDGPYIFWALGVLAKELWQFEVAEMWFNQMSRCSDISNDQQALAYFEYADTLAWADKDLDKAAEFAQLVIELDATMAAAATKLLVHIYLKLGDVRRAQAILENDEMEQDDFEMRYLRGLLLYRNGDMLLANETWKPLLTIPVQSRRQHQMKQQLMRYYYEQEAYPKSKMTH